LVIEDTTAPVVKATPASMTMNINTQQAITLYVDTTIYKDNDLQYIKYTTDGTDPVEGSATYAAPLNLSANIGKITLKFRGRDNDGNWQAVQTATYTIDTQAPGFSALASTPSLVKQGNTVTVSFTVNESLQGSPTVLIDGQATVGVDTSWPTYVYKRVISGTETQGTRNISITIADRALNSVTDTSLKVNIDFTLPVFTPLAIGPRPVVSGNPVTVTFNASERLSATTTVNIMGHPATRINELYLNSKWTYCYISPNLHGKETTALVTVHGYDLAGNHAQNTDGWGNITATGVDVLGNTGSSTSSMDFIIEGQ